MSEVKIKNQIIQIEEDYNPLNDKTEEYMSLKQLAYFKMILTNTLKEIEESNKNDDELVKNLEREIDTLDEVDRANYEDEIIKRTRNRDRNINKEKKILTCLARIEKEEYGYCEETGDEIGLKRLLARPFTTLSVHAQEQKDMLQREKEKAINNELSSRFYIEDDN